MGYANENEEVLRSSVESRSLFCDYHICSVVARKSVQYIHSAKQ